MRRYSLSTEHIHRTVTPSYILWMNAATIRRVVYMLRGQKFTDNQRQICTEAVIILMELHYPLSTSSSSCCSFSFSFLLLLLECYSVQRIWLLFWFTWICFGHCIISALMIPSCHFSTCRRRNRWITNCNLLFIVVVTGDLSQPRPAWDTAQCDLTLLFPLTFLVQTDQCDLRLWLNTRSLQVNVKTLLTTQCDLILWSNNPSLQANGRCKESTYFTTLRVLNLRCNHASRPSIRDVVNVVGAFTVQCSECSNTLQ